jgi:hypothetical protein
LEQLISLLNCQIVKDFQTFLLRSLPGRAADQAMT